LHNHNFEGPAEKLHKLKLKKLKEKSDKGQEEDPDDLLQNQHAKKLEERKKRLKDKQIKKVPSNKSGLKKMNTINKNMPS